jgi:hypothetical protein
LLRKKDLILKRKNTKIMKKNISILIMAITSLCLCAQAQMVFVSNWTSEGGGVWAGTAGGVNVTLTANGSFSVARPDEDVSGWQYAANPGSSTQAGLGLSATPGWTLTTSAPCDVFLYACWWRGAGLDGPDSTGVYEFDRSFTIASGLGAATIAGNNLELGSNWGMGIMSFSNVSSLDCHTSWTGGGSEVGLVFAVEPVPEPTTLALAGLGGLSLLLFRRRK